MVPALDAAASGAPAPATPAGARLRQPLAGHLPALDGVRGLAILLVLLLHFVANARPTSRLEQAISWVLGYGTYGVDLFFILSGFLITGILYDARGSQGYFKNFYMRRVLRIFPLYYGVLVLLFVVAPRVPWLRGATLDEIGAHQAWVWLYGTNIFLGIRGELALPYIDHFWSLAVEEHFYFVWPLLVWLLADRPRRLLATSLAIAGLSLALRMAAPHLGISQTTVFVLTPFRLDALCLGGFLAVLGRQPGGLARITAWLRPASWTAGVLLVASFAFNRVSDAGVLLMRPLRSSLILVLLAVLLLRALTAPSGAPISRLFRSGPMTFLGKYSYGIYVFHHFISYYMMSNRTENAVAAAVGNHLLAVLLQAAAGMALSALVAVASYHLFEKHFLSLKRFWPGVR